MMTRSLSATLIAATFLVTLAGCGGATPEAICEKAKAEDRADCTKELTELKTKMDAVDKSLWSDFGDCIKKESSLEKKSVKACLGSDTMEKLKGGEKK